MLDEGPRMTCSRSVASPMDHDASSRISGRVSGFWKMRRSGRSLRGPCGSSWAMDIKRPSGPRHAESCKSAEAPDDVTIRKAPQDPMIQRGTAWHTQKQGTIHELARPPPCCHTDTHTQTHTRLSPPPHNCNALKATPLKHPLCDVLSLSPLHLRVK